METVETGTLQYREKVHTLKKSLIFSKLDDDQISELSSLAIERDYATGQFIFWEGDDPDCFYMITEGEVRVLKHSSLGKEFTIAFFEPGEIFGEVAVFENKPYPASAQAASDVRVLSIKRQDFLSFITKHPEVALHIINILGGRLRNAQGRLRDLAGERIEQRLTRVLLMLSAKLGSTLPFTRQEIAEMAGTTTETAIRFMRQLKERGIIRSTRGQIVILNETKLKLLAEGPPQL